MIDRLGRSALFMRGIFIGVAGVMMATTAFGTDFTISGADAATIADLLKSAGVPVESDVYGSRFILDPEIFSMECFNNKEDKTGGCYLDYDNKYGPLLTGSSYLTMRGILSQAGMKVSDPKFSVDSLLCRSSVATAFHWVCLATQRDGNFPAILPCSGKCKDFKISGADAESLMHLLDLDRDVDREQGADGSRLTFEPFKVKCVKEMNKPYFCDLYMLRGERINGWYSPNAASIVDIFIRAGMKASKKTIDVDGKFVGENFIDADTLRCRTGTKTGFRWECFTTQIQNHTVEAGGRCSFTANCTEQNVCCSTHEHECRPLNFLCRDNSMPGTIGDPQSHPGDNGSCLNNYQCGLGKICSYGRCIIP